LRHWNGRKKKPTGEPPVSTFASGEVIGDFIYVFGGESSSAVYTNTLTKLNTNTWHWSTVEATGQVPEPRAYQASTVVAGKLLIIAGQADHDDDRWEWYRDIHIFDPNTDMWKKVPANNWPSPRSAPTVNIVGTTAYMFGGGSWEGNYRNISYYSDIFALDISPILRGDVGCTLSWEKIDAIGDIPSPRAGHAATTIGNYILVTGGYICKGRTWPTMADTYLFDPSVSKWTKCSDLPKPIGNHKTIYKDGKLFLFGGIDYNIDAVSSSSYFIQFPIRRSYHLAKAMLRLYNERDDQETQVELDDGNILKYHKFIMVARAPKCLTEIEKNGKLINVSRNTFNIFLGWMYCDQIPQSLQLNEIIELIDFFIRTQVNKNVVLYTVERLFKYFPMQLHEVKKVLKVAEKWPEDIYHQLIKKIKEGNHKESTRIINWIVEHCNKQDIKSIVSTDPPLWSSCGVLDTLGYDMDIIWDNHDTADFTLVLGEQKIKCHKSMLSSRCSYFDAILRSGMREAQNRELALPEGQEEHGMTYTSLCGLIRYFYSGSVDHLEDPFDCLMIMSYSGYLDLAFSEDHKVLMDHCKAKMKDLSPQACVKLLSCMRQIFKM